MGNDQDIAKRVAETTEQLPNRCISRLGECRDGCASVGYHPAPVSIDFDEELLAATVAALHQRLDADEPWRLDALCREPAYSTNVFFIERGQHGSAAKGLCARCLVHDECLA